MRYELTRQRFGGVGRLSPMFALVFVVLICSLGGVRVAQAAEAGVTGVAPEFAALITRCAPTVHPETMAALISAESRGHQFAIADAGPVKLPWAQRKALVRSYFLGSVDEATTKATELIAAGHTVSLGLSQVNDRNLGRLGLTVRAMFDPCTNLATGGKIVTEFYMRAVKKFGPGGKALRAAVSAYNSGDWVRGESEGYVRLVFKQIGRPLGMMTAAVVPAATHGAGRNGGLQEIAMKKTDVGRAFSMSVSEFSVAQ